MAGFGASGGSTPASDWKAVTPSDTVNFPAGKSRGIFVGTSGDVVAVSAYGSLATFKSASGQYHPIEPVRINATGTTAANIVALY